MLLSARNTSFLARDIDENFWKCPGCDEEQHYKDICSICKIERPAKVTKYASVEVLPHMFAGNVEFSKAYKDMFSNKNQNFDF